MKLWKIKGLVTHESKYSFPDMSVSYKLIKFYNNPTLGI